MMIYTDFTLPYFNDLKIHIFLYFDILEIGLLLQLIASYNCCRPNERQDVVVTICASQTWSKSFMLYFG